MTVIHYHFYGHVDPTRVGGFHGLIPEKERIEYHICSPRNGGTISRTFTVCVCAAAGVPASDIHIDLYEFDGTTYRPLEPHPDDGEVMPGDASDCTRCRTGVVYCQEKVVPDGVSGYIMVGYNTGDDDTREPRGTVLVSVRERLRKAKASD